MIAPMKCGVSIVVALVAAGCAGSRPTQVADGQIAGFATPESVLHDGVTDELLVTEIVGKPLEKDGKGRIHKFAADATTLPTAAWIESGRNGVVLDAPKGMAVTRGVLFVADIDVVRKFDRRSGASIGTIPIPGATFLNDVVVLPDGSILVSDSGMDAAFEPNGTDALWRIGADDGVERFVSGPDVLHGPNGLAFADGRLWVACWRKPQVLEFSFDGVLQHTHAMPGAQLDGIAVDANGTRYVSSWQTATIYAFDDAGVRVVADGLTSPADFAFDIVRRRFVVPLFLEDRIVRRGL